MSLFEAELRVRFNSTPNRPWYLLSGPRPSNPNEPGTSLRYEGKKFIWEIASAYEDTEGTVIIASEEVDIEVGKWFSVRVKFETNNLQGDILFGESIANESIKETHTQEGELYFSMAPVGEIGWNGASGDYSVFRLYTNDAGKEGWFDLFDREVQEPNIDEIEPSFGSGENLKWDSRSWKASVDGGFMHRMQKNYYASSNGSASSRRYYFYMGFLRDSISGTYSVSARGSTTPNMTSNLPDIKITRFLRFDRNLSSTDSRWTNAAVRFQGLELLLEGDIDCRDYRLKVTNVPRNVAVSVVMGKSGGHNFTEAQADSLIPKTSSTANRTEDYIFEITPATLQEQIEAKVKPAYAKDSIHYNIDDEPVTLDEKGFIYYPEPEPLPEDSIEVLPAPEESELPETVPQETLSDSE